MFKKLLASVGIGSAKVDTYVLTEHLTPGADCDLRVVIQAGDSVEQDINGLTLALCTSAKSEKEVGDSEVTVNETIILGKWAINPQELGLHNGVLAAGQTIEQDLTIKLHDETPVTDIAGSKSHVWIKTGLDIDMGLDSSDKDYLAIKPNPIQLNALNALHDMGYQLFKVDVEKGRLNGNGFSSSVPCYQEFELRRPSGLFSKSEVEISFVQLGQQVGILVEKDRFFGGDAYYSSIVPASASTSELKQLFESWL